jgi:bifunctional pyridoxal-dependent enzyme with beta-cystathionase and maltose regulon repressor activities
MSFFNRLFKNKIEYQPVIIIDDSKYDDSDKMLNSLNKIIDLSNYLGKDSEKYIPKIFIKQWKKTYLLYTSMNDYYSIDEKESRIRNFCYEIEPYIENAVKFLENK